MGFDQEFPENIGFSDDAGAGAVVRSFGLDPPLPQMTEVSGLNNKTIPSGISDGLT